MDLTAFTASKTGKLVPAGGSLTAFVPDPLPIDITLEPATWRAASDADAALGELKGIGHLMRNPYLLIKPFLRREAILSSKMEGTITTPEQLVIFEAGEIKALNKHPAAEDPSSLEQTREVFNYVRAMNHGLELLNHMPFCLRMIRGLHEVLMDGVRGNEAKPGEFRKKQNGIGFSGRPLEEARFVGPPVQQMTDSLNNLEKYINEDLDQFPLLMKMAIIHYQFETIHPFEDGNGRVGRLMIPLMLCAKNRLQSPLLYLSPYFEKNKTRYVDLMFSVSTSGTWQEWMKFFLAGVEEQALDSIRRAKSLIDLEERYLASFQSPRTSSLNQKLVAALFDVPVLDVNRAVEILQVKPTTAYARIADLENAKIVKEVSGRKRDRTWVASEIIRLTE